MTNEQILRRAYSDRIKNFLKNPNIYVYKRINKLCSFIKVHKDRLPLIKHSNVEYKINCKDCDAIYRTDRMLKSRISEHKNHINWNIAQCSVITNHRLEYSHEQRRRYLKFFHGIPLENPKNIKIIFDEIIIIYYLIFY